MKNLIVIFLSIICVQCQSKVEQLTAQQVVDKAILSTCAGLCDTAEIAFTFRDKEYQSIRKEGAYFLSRMSGDSIKIKDVVSNLGLTRTKNGITVAVADSLKVNISDGVNSVHYFAQLPYGLNAPAVNKELVGEGFVKEQPYYKVKVTFAKEGGGTDFDDVFMYWIHKKNYTVDYLAYSYNVNGGGIRFREAFNVRTVSGIRFVDYNNYKPASLDIDLSTLDTAYEAGELSLLSKIELKNIAVN